MSAQPQHDDARSGRPGLRRALLGAAGLLVVAGLVLQATAPDPETLPVAEPQAPTLQTFEVRSEQARRRTEVVGLLEARRRVELFSEEPGRVLEVGAEELERVEADQLLVRMDPLRAEIALDRARAAVARAESEGILARANLERRQRLKGSDVASQSALEEALNASRLAKAAQLDARAGLAEAEDRLSKMVISAPFAGVLRSFPVEAGEYLQPGERIGELLEVDRLRIGIGVTDRQVLAIRAADRVRILADAQPDHAFEGEVIQVGSAIDLATRKFPIRIEVDNAEGLLLPGMVTRVELSLGEPGPIVPIPLDAVMDEYGLKHVFVVAEADGETRVMRRRVELRELPFRPTDLDVVAGLSVGERIAISSVRQLRDGMAVRPLPAVNRQALGRLEAAP